METINIQTLTLNSSSPTSRNWENFQPRITRLRERSYDPKRFEPLITGKAIDNLFSRKVGLMPATVNMICGAPGVGKTTVCLDILVQIQQNYPDLKVLYIPSEMNENDMFEEAEENPALLDVPTLFINEYIDQGLDQVIESTFEQGFAVILLDSFVDIIDKVAEEKEWSIKKAEQWLLSLMLKTANQQNTCFLCIQQFTKGGDFVGSNKLKHNTTSFLFILRDKESKPYIEFHKNRRNGSMVFKRLYFKKDKATGEIGYDWKRFEKEELLSLKIDQEQERMELEEIDFEKIFEIQG